MNQDQIINKLIDYIKNREKHIEDICDWYSIDGFDIPIFHQAVQNNEIEIVKIFLDKSDSSIIIDYIHYGGGNGSSALQIALENKNEEMIDLFLTYDFDFDIDNSVENIETIDLYLSLDLDEYGDDEEGKNLRNNDLLCYVIEINHIKVFNKLVSILRKKHGNNFTNKRLLLNSTINVEMFNSLYENYLVNNLVNDRLIKQIINYSIKYFSNIKMIDRLIELNYNIDDIIKIIIKTYKKDLFFYVLNKLESNKSNEKTFNLNLALINSVRYGNVEMVKWFIEKNGEEILDQKIDINTDINGGVINVIINPDSFLFINNEKYYEILKSLTLSGVSVTDEQIESCNNKELKIKLEECLRKNIKPIIDSKI